MDQRVFDEVLHGAFEVAVVLVVEQDVFVVLRRRKSQFPVGGGLRGASRGKFELAALRMGRTTPLVDGVAELFLERAGVEIDGLLADDINRSVIQEQVEMGVAVRMAAMDLLAQNLRATRIARPVKVMV